MAPELSSSDQVADAQARKRPRVALGAGLENSPVNSRGAAINGGSTCTTTTAATSSTRSPIRNPYSSSKKQPKVPPLAHNADQSDCLVASPPGRQEPSEGHTASEHSTLKNADDDEVMMLDSNLTNPTVAFAHGRPDCGSFPFTEDKLKYCEKCYCIPCDKPASDCIHWETHCQTTKRSAKSEVIKATSHHDVIDIEDSPPVPDAWYGPIINPAVQSYYARNEVLFRLQQMEVGLDPNNSNNDYQRAAYNERGRQYPVFDNHYTNDFNHSYGDGFGKPKRGRNPRDMKITEVLAQKLMDAIQLSEGKSLTNKGSETNSSDDCLTSLNVQRKERYDKSRMEGDISQLGLQKDFFVEGVRIGWPYPVIMTPQRQMAIHLIKALKNKRHVVLESPTGTGKSAAILCAVLAWQRFHAKMMWGKTIEEGSALNEIEEEMQHAEIEFLSQEETFPRIIYCSRTHSQVEQMVSSLQKTPYRPRMTVLGSRERLCIHRDINDRNPSNGNSGQKKSKDRTNINLACRVRVQNTEKLRRSLWRSDDYHYNDDDPPTDLPGDIRQDAISQDDDEEDTEMDEDVPSSDWIHKKSTKKRTCPHYRQLSTARTAQMTRSNFIVNQSAIDCCTSGGEKTKLGVNDIEDLVSFGLNPYKKKDVALYRINGEGSFGFELGQTDCRIKKIEEKGAAGSNNLLRIGDRVVAVNGRKMTNFSQICQEIKNSEDPLELTVLRYSRLTVGDDENGEQSQPQEIDVVIQRPSPCRMGFGMTLMQSESGKGCFIENIEPGGVAEGCGKIHPGTEVIFVNGRDVRNLTPQQVVEEIENTKNNVLEMRVRHSSHGEDQDIVLRRPPSKLGMSLEHSSETGCSVKYIAEGGAVEANSEIEIDDIIVAVNGDNVEALSFDEIVNRLSNSQTDKLVIRVRRFPLAFGGNAAEGVERNDAVDSAEADRYSPHSACPYYISRALGKHAELIFAPYNYVLDPAIRTALDINLNGAVVVLDEAHNVEGTLTESGSGKFGEIELANLISFLSFYASANPKAGNSVTMGEGREKMDLSIIAHELLIFVEKLILHMRQLKVQFENSTGPNGAAKALDDYRSYHTPDDQEFEVSYDGPNGHGVLRKAVGCKPFFEKLQVTEKEVVQLLEFSKAMESHLTGSDKSDKPDSGNNSDQGKNTTFDLLNGLVAKFCLAIKVPEHFYVSCVIQANGNLDFAAGIDDEAEGSRRRFKKNPKTLPYIYPRSKDIPNAGLPVCGHQKCKVQGLATLGYRDGVRHGDWCKGEEAPKWEAHIVLKLLFPGLLMKDLATHCRSVILASGSLSPLLSLCAELDLRDEAMSQKGRLQTKPKPLEADHVVNLRKQLLAVAVGNFPDGSPLTVTYSHYKHAGFFGRLGNAIATVIEGIPRGGVLVFFPSYSVLKKCVNCWNPFDDRRNGRRTVDSDNSCPHVWERFLRSKGKVIVEPTGSQDKFEAARDEYRETIEETGSCILLAVFRGKMSEGISFNDDNARCVICVGIPFPAARDRAILAKKAYNDEQRKLRDRTNLLPGQEWYAQEAFRAIAQALGRCIRHAADFGTIILMDSRHCNDGSPGFTHSNLPKWMRGSVRTLSMTNHGVGQNPIKGGYVGLSHEMRSFFHEAPIHAQTVIEKMKLDLAKAQEREKHSSGHQFNSRTGGWTPTRVVHVEKAHDGVSKRVTQESPSEDIVQRAQHAAIPSVASKEEEKLEDNKQPPL